MSRNVRGSVALTPKSKLATTRDNPIAQINTNSVQNWAVSRLGVTVFFPNENERSHARTIVLRPLSYLWCCCRGALCAAFRFPALRTTFGPETFRRLRPWKRKEFRWAQTRPAQGSRNVFRYGAPDSFTRGHARGYAFILASRESGCLIVQDDT
jgi:hypothetical protein